MHFFYTVAKVYDIHHLNASLGSLSLNELTATNDMKNNAEIVELWLDAFSSLRNICSL